MPITMQKLEECVGFPLEEYQKEYITCEAKNMVALWGRKAGKSTALECRFAWIMENKSVPGQSLSGGIGLMTVGQREASEILRGVQSILEANGWIFVKERRWISKDAEGRTGYASAHEILLPNKNRMLALPCGFAGKTVRPYSFYELAYDEADFIPYPVFEATSPCLARFNGTRNLLSTINEEANRNTYFAEAFFGKLGEWKRWDIPTTRAKHVSREFLLSERSRLGKIPFEREYLNVWKASAQRVFDIDLINGITNPEPFNLQEMWEKAESVHIGVDFARFGKDDNVLAFNFMIDGKAYVCVEIIKGFTRTTTVTHRIKTLIAQHKNVDKIVTDETGIGAGPTDSLVEEFGAFKIIGIENHKRIPVEGRKPRFQKVDIYTNTLRLMEERKVVLDQDIDIRRSLGNMQWSYTALKELTIWGNDSHIAEGIVRCLFPIYRPGPRWEGEIKFDFIPS